MLLLARSQGADLACFEHSMKEMRGILQGARAALARNPGAESSIRGVARHYRESGATPADLDMAITTLEKNIQAQRISVVAPPPHTSAYSVDEIAFEDVLQRTVGYRDRSTLRVDLDSLTAIHRIRHGVSDLHLETCKAVLVTNNYNLVKASRSFFNSGRHEWPLAMLDNAITTLLWVKTPTSAPELPRRQIIADCYSALAPSASLWTKLVDEVDRLDRRGTIDADGVALLRYSREAQRAVMDATYGDPRNITEATITTALGRAREAAAKPAEVARDQAMARAAQAEAHEVEARFDAEQSQAESRELRDRVARLEAKSARTESSIRNRIARRASVIAGTARAVAALIVFASVMFGAGSYFSAASDWLPAWSSPWIRGGALVGFLLGVVTLWRGKSVTEWIENWRDRAIARALVKAGVEDPVDV